MDNFNENLEKYAKLLIESGVVLQKGQELVLSCPIECADFAHIIIRKAWEAGAKDVVVVWGDNEVAKQRFLHANDELLKDSWRFERDTRLAYSERGAAYLSIIGDDPEAFADVDAAKISLESKTKRTVIKPFSDKQMSNKLRWCIGAAPTKAWADKVFPDNQNSIGELWDKIFTVMRIYEEDPKKAWEEHHNNLKKKCDWLNERQFKTLHYTNSLGTDFIIGLPKNHMWTGGGEEDVNGVQFFANMPTEEVFTLPDKNTANGKLVASMSLNVNGNTISDFSFEFKDGKVKSFTAQKGKEMLQHIIETDEGSNFLGEVALVPYDSPISNMKTLFYETLFDENASCHFALGEAYPCFSDVKEIDDEEMKNRGKNNSLEHVDFMVGTEDLCITGVDKDDNQVDIFKNGNWSENIK